MVTATYPESISNHVAAFEGAVEQISGQFLQQSPPGPEGNVLNGPPVFLHALHYLWKNTHTVKNLAIDQHYVTADVDNVIVQWKFIWGLGKLSYCFKKSLKRPLDSLKRSCHKAGASWMMFWSYMDIQSVPLAACWYQLRLLVWLWCKEAEL